MKVLVIGSGGREHAIALKLRQSALLDGQDNLLCLPGNPGTAKIAHNIPIAIKNHAAICAFARENRVDLVVIGPEAPLADGLADELRDAGIRVFGPSRMAAQIESSKVFSKAFCGRWGIPTARHLPCSSKESAVEALQAFSTLPVIKVSGLAAGKGVFLPDSQQEAESILHAIFENDAFGDAGQQVVIEERLSGPEVSCMAFSDGYRVKLIPPAQDHKRLLDGDKGPNTGGMGAFAPSALIDQVDLRHIEAEFLQRAIDGMRAEGTPFQGVLYAGLLLTQSGPMLLEYNARFGDPETQVVLPLLEGDLLEIMLACADGNLPAAEQQLIWKQAAAVCITVASAGYPDKPQTGTPIQVPSSQPDGIHIIHAGTQLSTTGELLTAGGRVFGVTAVAKDLESARRLAYASTQEIQFTGMQFRSDIGLRRSQSASYAQAGVDIDAGNKAVSLMRRAVKSTYTGAVLSEVGSFGGLYSLAGLDQPGQSILVATIDGVGTKVSLAAELGRMHGVGQDLVNHCINDLLVQGASPLFFLDYVASDRLEPEKIASAVTGMADACKVAGCALIGGETAEMPGVYSSGKIDLAGCMVGIVSEDRLLPRPGIEPGCLVLGLKSSGLHTNGYSLARQLVAGTDLTQTLPGVQQTLADALLAVHRSYQAMLNLALSHPTRPILGLAHITGGGLVENLPRILPKGCGININGGAWPVPEIFNWLQRAGNIPDFEMRRTFNMGIGMAIIISGEHLPLMQDLIEEEFFVIGQVVAGEGVSFTDGS